MYITEITNPSWGNNELGDSPLEPGDDFFQRLPEGRYDVLLGLETGALVAFADLSVGAEPIVILANDFGYGVSSSVAGTAPTYSFSPLEGALPSRK